MKDNRDSKRSDILRELKLFHTEQAGEFADIVKLAALFCDVPISVISLFDKKRQWFKVKTGTEQTETTQELSFCNHTLNSVLVVEDATKDQRFMHNPMVTGPEHIRFYAGVPIILKGESIGALCVTDTKARALSQVQRFGLETLSNHITQLLELRLQNNKLQDNNEELEQQKKKLRESNDELSRTTRELSASEEALRTSLEQISQLKQFLEIGEKQYRDLVENASDMIYELDATGRFIFVNNIMETKCGYPRAALLQKYYWNLVHPDDCENVFEFYRKQLKNKEETSYLEFRMVASEGNEIWIGQNVRMFFNDERRVYRVLSISRDITALKKIEHKLEESEKLYRLLSTNSKDMVSLFEVNENATRKFISPSVKFILGYDPEELIGKGAFELVHPADLEKFKKITDDYVLKGRETSFEYRALKKDGTTIWLESNINPVFDELGTFTGFQTSTRDITKRKEFETCLLEAKEKAEEATRAKSEFLSMMSHEIRTPMNGIIGLTTLVMQNNPRPDQMDHLKLLRFSGENLLTIINDILDFSKIEANKITIELIEIDLYRLVLNIRQIQEQRALEKGIVLHFRYDDQIPKKLFGDPVRIAQVISNLVSNAIKFTEKGSINLTVDHRGKQGQTHFIHFEIKDTGIGISNDKLEIIFERFSQAEAETTRKFGGTGLGLSITKSLLEKMDSEIKVESKIGTGSTFSFVLALKDVISPINAEHVIQEVLHTSDHPVNTSGIRVLLAEDNMVNQIVASGLLTEWGIEVDVANDGHEAVEMVKNGFYDVVLMDLQMPKMDGYESSKVIRQMNDAYFKNLPIIALSASAMPGMEKKVRESGMTDFISKPFSPTDLRSKILKYVTRPDDLSVA